MELQNPAVATAVAEPETTVKAWPTYDHAISLEDARDLIARWRRANPDKRAAGAFTRVPLDRILAQKGCCGIRAHFAMNPDETMTLVLVGTDEFGNDMDTGYLAEQVFPCPPFCPMDSALDR